jgi:hypothetical protein
MHVIAQLTSLSALLLYMFIKKKYPYAFYLLYCLKSVVVLKKTWG